MGEGIGRANLLDALVIIFFCTVLCQLLGESFYEGFGTLLENFIMVINLSSLVRL
jgi:hypothetical protein